MATLTTDPIMSEPEAQEIFDFTDDDERVRLINHLSAKARAWLARVRLINSATAIVEYLRGPATPTFYLHAAVDTSDFGANDLTVEAMRAGVVSETYVASDLGVIVTTDEYHSRVDLAVGCFAAAGGGDLWRVTYNGGWAAVPGDVLAGAIMQGRVDLKRLRGEVGLTDRSSGGESMKFDTHGVLSTVADLWRPYQMVL